MFCSIQGLLALGFTLKNAKVETALREIKSTIKQSLQSLLKSVTKAKSWRTAVVRLKDTQLKTELAFPQMRVTVSIT